MELIEKRMNIFDVDLEKYYLAHSISADYRLGRGLAYEFESRFCLKYSLFEIGESKSPDCILIGKIFNLVTKDAFFQRASYEDIRASLYMMKDIIINNKIKYIAMPKICCGSYDKKRWYIIRGYLNSIFDGYNLEILVCYK